MKNLEKKTQFLDPPNFLYIKSFFIAIKKSRKTPEFLDPPNFLYIKLFFNAIKSPEKTTVSGSPPRELQPESHLASPLFSPSQLRLNNWKAKFSRLSPFQSMQTQQTLPPVSYTKAIDVWLATCVVFVFLRSSVRQKKYNAIL